MGTLSGPLGSTLIHQTNALQVWARMVNDRGGLNGHPIKLLISDDGADPARHRAEVQKLVERDKVVAFVANGEAVSGAASIEYHNKVRVPVLGSEGANQYFYESPMHFPQMATGDSLQRAFIASFAQQVIPEGKKRLATMVCREAATCDVADRMWGEGYAKELGFEVVYRAKSSVAQPDFTAECLNARSAGADVMFIEMDANSVGRVTNSCGRQSYKPIFGWGANATNDSQPKDPTMAGGAVAATTFPWMVKDTPATAEFHAAMARYLPNVKPNGSHSVGWTAAKMFEAAASNMSEPPTATAVLEGLWSLKGNDLGGLTYPLTFEREKPAPERTCWFNVRLLNGQFSAPAGSRYTCR